MTATVTTAFWSVTINNYDDKDLAIIRNGYPDYCREIVHTLEEGEQGTPHIQAWVKLQRQQRMSFMRKLFPGGHFKPLTSAEYVQNTKMYAQKQDETTQSAHVHVFHDPTGTVEALIPQVIHRMWDHSEWMHSDSTVDGVRQQVEREMVTENYRLAKVFVSAVYKQMWKQFGESMLSAISRVSEKEHTHTHTHTDEKFSRRGSITNDAEEDGEEDTEDYSGSEEEDGEDYTEGDGSGDEAYSEGGDYGTGEDTSGEED